MLLSVACRTSAMDRLRFLDWDGSCSGMRCQKGVSTGSSARKAAVSLGAACSSSDAHALTVPRSSRAIPSAL